MTTDARASNQWAMAQARANADARASSFDALGRSLADPPHDPYFVEPPRVYPFTPLPVSADAMSEFSEWLHHLPAAHIAALREFRRVARETYPDSPVPVASALAGLAVPPLIRSMPPHLVRLVEHEAE